MSKTVLDLNIKHFFSWSSFLALKRLIIHSGGSNSYDLHRIPIKKKKNRRHDHCRKLIIRNTIYINSGIRGHRYFKALKR